MKSRRFFFFFQVFNFSLFKEGAVREKREEKKSFYFFFRDLLCNFGAPVGWDRSNQSHPVGWDRNKKPVPPCRLGQEQPVPPCRLGQEQPVPQELREELGGFYSVSVRMPRQRSNSDGGDNNAAASAAALSAALGPAAVLLPSRDPLPSSSSNSNNDGGGEESPLPLLRFRVAAAPATPGGLDLASLYERLEKATTGRSRGGGGRYSVSQASLEDVFVDVVEREAGRERGEREQQQQQQQQQGGGEEA